MVDPPVVNEVPQPPMRILTREWLAAAPARCAGLVSGRERSAWWFEEQADEALRRAAEMRRAAEATGGRPAARGEAGAERIKADS